MPENSPGQLLLVGVPGPELDPATAAAFRKIQPAGFILFGRNIQTPQQLRRLLDDLRDLSGSEPILTIDQEGGRVSRLKLLGNEPPNAVQLAARGEPELIRRHGRLTGELLRLFGFNLNLCPVLDIGIDEAADNSLRGRCHGSTVGRVIQNAGVFNQALQETGILTCGKHFPGYTHAGEDPHHGMPAPDRSREQMDACELAVFRAFADKVDSMMVGHIWAGCLDAERRPASLSPAVVDGILRGELGFGGLVMTDDLDMGAVLDHCPFDDAMRAALLAGNDLLMICHRVEMAQQAARALAQLPAATIDRALGAIENFRRKLAPPAEFSPGRHGRLDAEVWRLRVDVLGAEGAAARSPEDGKRSPVELY